MSISNVLEDMGKTVSFSVYPTAVLGVNFTKVTLLGVLDYESALQYIDIASLAVMIWHTLPPGVLKDPTKYRYLKIKDNNGKSTCVALEWIIQSTYVVHGGMTMSVEFDNATAIDADKVRAILAANGYPNVKIHF